MPSKTGAAPSTSYLTVVFASAVIGCAICAGVAVRAVPDVLLLAAIAAAPQARPQGAWREPLILAALVAWAAVSLLWSPVGESLAPRALEHATALKLAVVALAGVGLVWAARRTPPAGARRVGRIMAVALALLALLLIWESATAASFYRALNQLLRHRPTIVAERDAARSAYLLALLIWPAAAASWRWRQPLLVVPPALAILAAAAGLRTGAPAVAFAAAALAFVLVLAAGRVAAAVVGLASSLAWLAAPWLFAAGVALIRAARHGALPLSWTQRLGIWERAQAPIAARPWLGWGLDGRATVGLGAAHTHSAPLQYWLELGAPGAALSTALIGALWLRIWGERDRLIAAAGAGALVAFLVISAVSFSAWEEWWLAMGLLAAVAVILLQAAPHEPDAT